MLMYGDGNMVGEVSEMIGEMFEYSKGRGCKNLLRETPILHRPNFDGATFFLCVESDIYVQPYATFTLASAFEQFFIWQGSRSVYNIILFEEDNDLWC